MIVRRVAILAAIATMAASGIYVVVYTYRWEWNRAMFAALVFLIAEVGSVGAYLASRMSSRMTNSMTGGAPDMEHLRNNVDPAVLARLRQNGAQPNYFSWLDPANGRTSVFITILLSAGVVVSGAAWLIQRIAARTTTPALETRLARQLAVFHFPAGQLRIEESELLAGEADYERNEAIRFLVLPGGGTEGPVKVGTHISHRSADR